MKNKIKHIFEDNNIQISSEQSSRLYHYYELLIEWNKRINLTAITEYEEVIRKHFLDSAILVNYLNQTYSDHKNRVLDLGTGAGFPGIVLALFCPNYKFTLLDSLQKRIDFLKLVVSELELNNVELYHGRAEDYGRKVEFRNQFDFVVSRAVAELPILMEYCIPFVKKDGLFISYKGAKYLDEIDTSKNACLELNCNIENIEEFILNNIEKRYLLFIRNKEITNEKYPRKSGKPKKKPL